MAVKIDSTAPEAPSKCPMAPLFEITGTFDLMHFSRADNSISSPSCVDVAWAFTATISNDSVVYKAEFIALIALLFDGSGAVG